MRSGSLVWSGKKCRSALGRQASLMKLKDYSILVIGDDGEGEGRWRE